MNTISLGVTLLLCVACASATSHPELRIDGSPGVAPLVSALADAYMREHPRAPVQFGRGLGSSARIQALAEGRIDIAMASHGVDTAALRHRGLVAHEIARTAVVFAVTRSVPLTTITSVEVCDLVAGHAATSPPIAVYTRPPTEVDAEVAFAAVPCMKATQPGPRTRVVDRPDELADSLLRADRAIGLTSMPYVRISGGRLRALSLDGVEPTDSNVLANRYRMSRRAILLTRAAAGPAAERFLEFARSAAGRDILRKSGAIPLAY